MRIELDEDFSRKLGNIIGHIAEDKVGAAIVFKNNLLKSIKGLLDSPYKYRQSFYFDDEDIRDMTYKGYTIVYKIYPDEKRILVVDIFNRNKPSP